MADIFSTDKNQVENYPETLATPPTQVTSQTTPDTMDLPRDYDELRITKDRGFFGVTLPVSYLWPFRNNTSSATINGSFPQVFFTANRPYKVISVVLRYENGSAAGNTMTVEKLTPGTTLGAGAPIGPTLTVDTTERTPKYMVPFSTSDSLLAEGDSLGVTIAGASDGFGNSLLSVILRAV